MGRGGVPGGLRRRCLLLLLLPLCLGGAVFQQAGTLELKMESQMTAHLDADVILPCDISGYPGSELNINKIAVIWYLETSGSQKIIYSFVAGYHTSHRNGSRLDESKLKEGHAELFLPQIQVNEAGTYTCSVTITPDKAEGTTFLELVAGAQPVTNTQNHPAGSNQPLPPGNIPVQEAAAGSDQVQSNPSPLVPQLYTIFLGGNGSVEVIRE